jgi:hypothetical protein
MEENGLKHGGDPSGCLNLACKMRQDSPFSVTPDL